MNRIHLLAVVAALAVTASVALVAIASTAAVSRPETITLRGLPERFEPLEGFSAEGVPSTGARAVITEKLHRLSGGKVGARVGRTEILCTVIGTWKGSHRAPSHCTASYGLPDGKILVVRIRAVPRRAGRVAGRDRGRHRRLRGRSRLRQGERPAGVPDEQRHPSEAVEHSAPRGARGHRRGGLGALEDFSGRCCSPETRGTSTPEASTTRSWTSVLP